jgi:type II secretory pathway component PulM
VRALPAPPASKTDLRTLVQARIEVAGLARALVRIDAPDSSQVQVVFGAVSFADWLALVANLQAEHIRLDTSRIEALSTTGMVGVTATLTRARQQ